jgi:DNA-binding HxlR family transcriptional regulator
MAKKKSPPPVPDTHRILKRLLGCKWSFSIFPLLRAGINRPGAIERSIDGMTAKVLGECLRKNVSLGLLEKKTFPEIPPRVEYHFTAFGRRFLKMFAVVESFQAEIEAQAQRSPAKKRRRPARRRI